MIQRYAVCATTWSSVMNAGHRSLCLSKGSANGEDEKVQAVGAAQEEVLDRRPVIGNGSSERYECASAL